MAETFVCGFPKKKLNAEENEKREMDFRQAKNLSTKLYKMIDYQVGDNRGFLVGVIIRRVNPEKNQIPKGYNQNFYITILHKTEFKQYRDLIIPKKYNDLLVLREESGPCTFG